MTTGVQRGEGREHEVDREPTRSVVVVVPAHDERETIGGCLRALAAQTVGTDSFEVILVADACTDGTDRHARRLAAELGLELTVLEGPGLGSGAARATGMDEGARRLRERASVRQIEAIVYGNPHQPRDAGEQPPAPLLLATTDADTRPAPDWLERQLQHLARGAAVVAGLIELDEELPPLVAARREREAAARLDEVRALDPTAEHHHFAGASLGIDPQVYLRVGGMEPRPALEDEAFAARLRSRGIPVLRAADVRVRTSTRRHGRARRGLAVDLAVADWCAHRRYRAEQFPIQRLRELKREVTVSVVLPAKECARTVGGVLERAVGPLRDAGLVDELVVVDAGSADGTARVAAAAGARVLQQDELLSAYGPAVGKGDAMWRALAATDGQLVCFLDADTEDPGPHHLAGLLGPLLAEPGLQLVKGAFERPLRAGAEKVPHEGGRVTELMARPLINLHFPLLAGFSQPLAGEFAARRELLEQLPFPLGYGVEIAVLIDALHRCGLDALAECDLGSRQNRHQPLRSLGEMAYAVLAAAERRIGGGSRAVAGGHYMRPWQDDRPVTRVPVQERPPLASLERRQD